MDSCEKCGAELHVGDWPYCPHGRPHWVVDAFEGYLDDNLGPEPIWITSATQRRKYMDANGIDFLEDKDRRHPKRLGSGPTLFFDMKR